MIRKISCAFTGGIIGALCESIIIWLLSHAGVSAMIGISLKPKFTTDWLYPRLIWGGLWALLLVLPILKTKTALRGIIFSLLPSAITLCIILPEMGKGMWGLRYGTLTPVLIVISGFIYGMIASGWYKNCTQ